MLRPFVVTAWHGSGASEMPADVRDIFQNSEQAKDPKRLNVFAFVLDPDGRLVHGFHGLPATRGPADGRSDYTKEIPNGLAKLKLPTDKPAVKEGPPLAVPDLKATGAGVPTGVRLFVRLNDEKDPFRSKMPVVEVVAMKADDWKILAFPEKARDVEAVALKSWLVQVYPAGIRAADQKKPFIKVSGTLKLEPAGADQRGRYALLRGEVKLPKGDAKESAVEGAVQAVLTYGLEAPEVKSVRAVVEGVYVYRLPGTRQVPQRMPLVAVVESRPE